LNIFRPDLIGLTWRPIHLIYLKSMAIIVS